ncbi:MAG: PfkB family carbohydrate kinase [Steroidobacteraceae bacterium]
MRPADTATLDGTEGCWTDIRRITALGEPLLELQQAQPAQADEIRLAFGGDVANSMVCLARILGTSRPEISLVTALGNSGYSAWLRSRLTREGIRLTEAPLEGEPGIYGLPVDSAPSAGFSYWRGQSAARRFLRAATLEQFEELLGRPQILLVTGITLALCSAASFEHLGRWVQRHRDECRVVFDCNFRRGLWDTDEEARARIGAFEPLASVIATGAEDEKSLWGAASTPQIIARLSRLSAEYLIRGGAEGCWVGSGRECRHVPTAPMAVVDTAGAGDAHFAGYLAARISGCGRTDAAAYANNAAAVIVSQRGSAPKENARFPPLPTRAGA